MKKIFFPVLVILCLSSGLILSAQEEYELGDVNGDHYISIIDALITAQAVTGLPVTLYNATAADVDGDGKTTIIDALMIAQFSVGLLAGFPAADQHNTVEILSSTLARLPEPDISDEELEIACTGINNFALDMYGELKQNGENLFFSPLSITYALSMCYAGAKENTEAEMARTLHITLPEERYHNVLNYIDQTISTGTYFPDSAIHRELKLNMINSSWGQKDYPFCDNYLDVLSLYYGAGLNIVDFTRAPALSCSLINNWVSDQTEGRIKNLVPLNSITSVTRLILTNAIYFKASWELPFEEKNTHTADFYPLAGNSVPVNMMWQSAETNYKGVPGEYQVIRLPYLGDKHNAMYILLPEQGQFETIENSLSLSQWHDIINGMTEYEVFLYLPQFNYQWDSSLVEALQNLGMRDAFVFAQADFNDISINKGLYIKDVLHKSFIAVDEKGTEATAATAVLMEDYSFPRRVTMEINRPFIFAIVNEDTGAFLFLGRFMQP